MLHAFKLTWRKFSVISEGNTQLVGPPANWAWKSEGRSWGRCEDGKASAHGLVSPHGADILEPLLLSESCKEVKRTISLFFVAFSFN